MARRMTILIAVLALVVSACGGGDGAGDGMVGLLATLPDTADTRHEIIFNDFAAVADTLGIDSPGRNATRDDFIEYMMTLTIGDVAEPGSLDDLDPAERRVRSTHVRAAPWGFNIQHMVGDEYLEAWYTAFGLSILDVDREATAGRPPNAIFIWEGAIDPAEVEAAVTSDPDWSADLNTYSHSSGYDYWCWGDDPLAINIDRRDSVRLLGQGGCLAAFDGMAIRTISRESMQAALTTAGGNAGSLADVEALSLAAEALDEAGTYAAYLSMDVGGFAAGPNAAAMAGDAGFLDLYQAVALGPAVEADGTELLVVVFVYADEASAATNAATFESLVTTGTSGVNRHPWAEILTIRSIEARGRVVVGVFDADAAVRLWLVAPSSRDTLILWD